MARAALVIGKAGGRGGSPLAFWALYPGAASH